MKQYNRVYAKIDLDAIAYNMEQMKKTSWRRCAADCSCKDRWIWSWCDTDCRDV